LRQLQSVYHAFSNKTGGWLVVARTVLAFIDLDAAARNLIQSIKDYQPI